MQIQLQKIAKPIGSPIQLYRSETGDLYLRFRQYCPVQKTTYPIYRAVEFSEEGDVTMKDDYSYLEEHVRIDKKLALV